MQTSSVGKAILGYEEEKSKLNAYIRSFLTEMNLNSDYMFNSTLEQNTSAQLKELLGGYIESAQQTRFNSFQQNFLKMKENLQILESIVTSAQEAENKKSFPQLDKKKKPLAGVTVQKGPRASCGCFATIHKFHSNCTICGRIFCEKEGPGACFYCGLDSSISSDIPNTDDYANAERRLQVLIEKDQQAIRSRVVDVDATWLSETRNLWTTEKERERAKNELHREKEAKKNIKETSDLILDFANMNIYLEDNEQRLADLNDQVQIDIEEHKKNAAINANEREPILISENNDLSFQVFSRLALDEITQKSNPLKKKLGASNPNVTSNPMLENELLEGYHLSTDNQKPVTQKESPSNTFISPPYYSDTSDTGACITMHQPWASLLVYGLKKLEGREWDCDFRGRLWIHAAVKQECHDEIVKSVVDQFYAEAHEFDIPLVVPTSYPTSCLLGCVDVVDTIPLTMVKEMQVQKLLPQEGNSSFYQMVCISPRRLRIPIQTIDFLFREWNSSTVNGIYYPHAQDIPKHNLLWGMSGKHKIWQLEGKLIRGLQGALLEAVYKERPIGYCVPRVFSQAVDRRKRNLPINDIHYTSDKLESAILDIGEVLGKRREVISGKKKNYDVRHVDVTVGKQYLINNVYHNDELQSIIDEIRQVSYNSEDISLVTPFVCVKSEQNQALYEELWLEQEWNRKRNVFTTLRGVDKKQIQPLSSNLQKLFQLALKAFAELCKKTLKGIPWSVTRITSCCIRYIEDLKRPLSLPIVPLDISEDTCLLTLNISNNVEDSVFMYADSKKEKLVRLCTGDIIVQLGASKERGSGNETEYNLLHDISGNDCYVCSLSNANNYDINMKRGHLLLTLSVK